MKLRYYLRGLGIGMIVTALLMGVALNGEGPLSDTEIRMRAMALGMVEGDSRTLADMQTMQGSDQQPSADMEPVGTAGPAPTESPAEEPTAEPASVEVMTATPIPRPSDRVTLNPPATDLPDSETASGLSPADAPEDQESVTFVIRSGQSSYGISKALVEAGLVEDAAVFDQYLEEIGYSKRISTGTYEIPLGATQEEIAKIITRSR